MSDIQIKHILEKLKDDDNYYGDFGKQFLSNSDIRVLMKDPLNFRQPTEEHINLLKGKYFHTAVLEPEKLCNFMIVDASSRNTKIYRDHVEFNKGEMCLLQKEKEELDELIEIMLSNSTARNLIRDIDVEYEVPGLINLEGEWWKMKADIVNKTQGVIVDLKTTGDIDKFRSSAWEYNYDSQAYIYSKYFNMDFIFVVMCKKSKRLGIFDCSEEFLDRGREKVEEAINLYRKFTDKHFDPKEYFKQETL